MTAKKKTSFSTDPVTQYARDVVSGKIIAGPPVRDACARHLRDLKEGPKRGLWWDVEAANRAIRFFESRLKLNGGQFEGLPFLLKNWQQFIVGSVFGWKKENGFRRFHTAYVETAKGSGKSPLAAGVGLYMMNADNEQRAHVYAFACDKIQANVMFQDAVAMVEQSPELSRRLELTGGNVKNNIANVATSSFFRPLSSEDGGKKGKSGLRPHCSIGDEVHEHPGPHMIDMMRAGQKSRQQPLLFLITNSGHDRQSVCFEYHDTCIKICSGELDDDGIFAYICAVDDNDDPLHDEACWIKANPSLPEIPGYDYLRNEVRHALNMPSAQNERLRLNFCVWTDSVTAFIGRDAWMACEHGFDDDVIKGLPCFGGLDLSSKRDLTAYARVWKAPDGFYYAELTFWTPEEGLREREDKDRVPYRQWVKEGYLHTTPGAAVDYAWVIRTLAGMHAGGETVEKIARDRYLKDIFDRDMEHLGVALPMEDFGQGYASMGPAINLIEEIIVNGRLKVRPNPVLRWNVASAAVVSDPAMGRKFDKRKATGRDDGMVALTEAIAIAEQAEVEVNPYNTRGVRTL